MYVPGDLLPDDPAEEWV